MTLLEEPPPLPRQATGHRARISLLGSLTFGDCLLSQQGGAHLTNTSADLRNLELAFSQFSADDILSKKRRQDGGRYDKKSSNPSTSGVLLTPGRRDWWLLSIAEEAYVLSHLHAFPHVAVSSSDSSWKGNSLRCNLNAILFLSLTTQNNDFNFQSKTDTYFHKK